LSRGRRRHRNTCESCLSIDVRQLHREGRLLAYQSFLLSWQFDNRQLGDISVRTEHDLLILRFEIRTAENPELKLVEQRVPIIWTPCALGGQRPWFRCIAESAGSCCGRRVAKIYLGGSSVFACRRCYGLAYRSQSNSAFHRYIAKAMQIRMRLGGSPSLLDPFPPKPKGLHRATYERLRRAHDAAEGRLA
jgi:hypothetical protein